AHAANPLLLLALLATCVGLGTLARTTSVGTLVTHSGRWVTAWAAAGASIAGRTSRSPGRSPRCSGFRSHGAPAPARASSATPCSGSCSCPQRSRRRSSSTQPDRDDHRRLRCREQLGRDEPRIA